MYRQVEELTKKKGVKACTLIDEDGNHIQGTDGIWNRWKEHLECKLNSTVLPDPSVLSSLPAIATDPRLPPLGSEVELTMKGLRTNKAAGPDGIQMGLLKVNCGPSVALHLKIATATWEDHFPSSWCEAMIVSLHKKGSKTICDNYQPISSTSHAAKILTRVMLECIRAEYQAGLRPNRSTIDQICTVRQNMEKCLKLGRSSFYLFINFKQAFDLIWREGLWYIFLHSGILQNLVSLIRVMYSKFRNHIMTGEDLSDSFETSNIVLQGCCLPPELLTCFLPLSYHSLTTRQVSLSGEYWLIN